MATIWPEARLLKLLFLGYLGDDIDRLIFRDPKKVQNLARPSEKRFPD
jgi:hypothetical protein